MLVNCNLGVCAKKTTSPNLGRDEGLAIERSRRGDPSAFRQSWQVRGLRKVSFGGATWMVDMLFDVRPKFADDIGSRIGGERQRAALNARPKDAVAVGLPGPRNESSSKCSGYAP